MRSIFPQQKNTRHTWYSIYFKKYHKRQSTVTIKYISVSVIIHICPTVVDSSTEKETALTPGVAKTVFEKVQPEKNANYGSKDNVKFPKQGQGSAGIL